MAIILSGLAMGGSLGDVITMNTDAELLRRFAEDRSEAAFTELVHRYLGLVHGAALRRVGGDTHAADDIAQQVFVALARKAPALRDHESLAGWLYVGTHHATAALVRREQRRKQREATAHSMHLNDSSAESAAEVARLRPLLDDALITLKPDEREAIVLRFFAGRSFPEIGAAVSLSEDAARKRVNRGLEKLHAVLARRGVTSSVAVLGSALTAAGLESAPTGLAIQVAGAALTKAAAPTLAATLANLLWPAAATAVLVGGTLTVAPLYQQNQATASAIAARESEAQAQLRVLQAENQQLGRELAVAKTSASEPEPAAELADASPVATASHRAAVVSQTVLITPAGTLKWDDVPVTLDTFLVNLATLQASGSSDGSRLVVQAHGAKFTHLTYVLDEARKAGVTNLIIESDTLPDGPTDTWF